MLDFTKRRELQELAQVVSAVQAAVDGVPSMLVGATARDLLLLHAHDIETVRKTNDVDIAIAVESWDVYKRLRHSLVAKEDVKAGRTQHQFVFGAYRVDLVPFGGLETPGRKIDWPPNQDEVMNVLGFSEALLSTVPVLLPGPVDTRVVSLPALVILKLVAWQDRHRAFPGKDAFDTWLLLRHYAEAGNEDLIYTNCITQLEMLDFDQDQAGAWLLGVDARRVLDAGTDSVRAIAAVRAILEPEIDPDGALRLIGEMPFGEKDRQLALLRDFYAGFVGEQP